MPKAVRPIAHDLVHGSLGGGRQPVLQARWSRVVVGSACSDFDVSVRDNGSLTSSTSSSSGKTPSLVLGVQVVCAWPSVNVGNGSAASCLVPTSCGTPAPAALRSLGIFPLPPLLARRILPSSFASFCTSDVQPLPEKEPFLISPIVGALAVDCAAAAHAPRGTSASIASLAVCLTLPTKLPAALVDEDKVLDR